MTDGTFDVEVPAGGLRWPFVYEEGDMGVHGKRFSLSFPADLLPVGLSRTEPEDVVPGCAGIRVSVGRDGVSRVHAGSRLRPEVAVFWEGDDAASAGRGDPVDALMRELQRLDARNLTRDRVFDGRRTALELKPYDHILRGRSHPALALLRVTVYL